MSDTTLSAAAALAAPPAAAPAAAPAAPAPAPAAAAPAPAPAVAAAPAPADPTAPPAAAPAPTDPPPLKLPGKDAKPEDWAAFYKQIGAPETPDAYKLTVPEGDDGAFAKQAAEVFAKAGLLPHQAEALNAWWNETQAGSAKAQAEAETAAVAQQQAQAKKDDDALKNEFQGDYDKMRETARKAAVEFFPAEKREEALSALESVLGYGGLYRMLNTIGAGLSEGTARGLNNPGGAPEKVPMEQKIWGEALAKAGLGPKT